MEKIKISQCMIVKNEEKNIERALTWAKNIVDEQIVVDTGSDDRTVELAENMGAKVLHFPWIHDFSAAKNYALDHANGDWIIFCDADESFIEQDIPKIPDIIAIVDREHSDEAARIQSNLVSVSSEGIPFCFSLSVRIFTRKGIRYQGKIHEYLTDQEGYHSYEYDACNELNIIHTGYGEKQYEDTQKIERNKEILFGHLDKNPENPGVLMYLGDCYGAEKDYDNAEKYYKKAIECSPLSLNGLTVLTWSYWGLLRIYLYNKPDDDKFLKVWRDAVLLNPEYPDYYQQRGTFEYNHNNWEKAIGYFEKAIIAENKYKGITPRYTGTLLSGIFASLVNASNYIKDYERVFKYSLLLLKLEKYNMPVLLVFLQNVFILKKNHPAEEVFEVLKEIYDFDFSKDRLVTLKAAQTVGSEALSEIIFELLSDTEKQAWKEQVGNQSTEKAAD